MHSLAIISHTEHYYRPNGEVVGLESTLREINYLTNLFGIIYHIAPLHKGVPHKANIPYASKKIIYIPIIPTGGKGIVKKPSQKIHLLSLKRPNLQGFSLTPLGEKVRSITNGTLDSLHGVQPVQ